MQNTIKESLQMVKDFRTASNEKLLEVHTHLVVLESSGVWKKKVYYGGDKTLEKFKDSSFSTFLKEVFAITIVWYVGINKILAVKNGKELFLEFGRGNMVTYINSTDEERKAIVTKARSTVVTRSFASLRSELYPNTKKEIIDIPNSWKNKYLKIKKDFEEYKAQTEESMSVLKKTIAVLSSGAEEVIAVNN